MVERLNISIPDELHRRLTAVRDKLKVSKICQVAIEEAVVLEESKEGGSIEALAVRVKKEKQQLFKPYWDEGFSDGSRDAMSFTYSEFVSFIEMNRTSVESIDEYYLASNDCIDKVNYFCQGGKLPIKDISRVPIGVSDTGEAEAYEDGWTKGVLFVWSEIKDKI